MDCKLFPGFQPVRVTITGKSAPLTGVDAVNGTTYVKQHNIMLEGYKKPLDRAKPRRRTTRLQKMESAGVEQRNIVNWAKDKGLSQDPMAKDKNIVL